MIRTIKRIIVWGLFLAVLAYLVFGPDIFTGTGANAAGEALKDAYGRIVKGAAPAWNWVKALPALPALPAAMSADRAVVMAGTAKAARFVKKAVRLALLAAAAYIAIRFLPWGMILAALA